MTGVNHNITFQSSVGGFVNVEGKNLKEFFGKIPDNLKQRLISMETFSASMTNSDLPNINNKLKVLDSFNSQLQMLSGQVQHNLSRKVVQLTQENQQLKNRIEELEERSQSSDSSDATIRNILTRLTTIEGLHRDRVATTTESINRLNQKVSDLEARPSPLSSSSRRRIFSQLRSLTRKAQALTRDMQRNECQSNPCRNGGSCYDRFNGFHCNCPNGWTGETCADDVNECAEYVGTDLGCQNGGTCMNIPGSYRCRCTADWHGLHCNSRHDDCTDASNSEICGHGTCVNQPRNQPGQPKFKCICDVGWTQPAGLPTCTEDVDECQSASSCFQHPSVHCINFPGSFICSSCPAGYTGNGFSCNDINECEVNNGGCSLNPRVTCINTVGSSTCGQCPTGYTGNGITCQYAGICQVANGGCNSLAICTANPYAIGGRVCSCNQGYIGTGIGPEGCRRLAPTQDPCQNNPCQNGGTCQVSTIGNYTCLCPSNFTGAICESRVNLCASNPCQNGGTCIMGQNSYICTCTTSFKGTRCETQRDECGGRFYNPSGMISYPSEPGVLYPHGIDCEWVITASSSKIVQLNFTRLQTECNYDWLDVVDSSHRYGSRIGRYCRLSDIPNNGTVNSTGRGIRLWLHSDASVAHEGFNVSWTSQEPKCGYEIRGRHHGILQSPRYPDNYPTYRTCQWTISMKPGKKISLLFNTFRLENHHSCNYDYLEIRNGLTPDSPLIGKYCNRDLPPAIISSGPYLYFKFNSDGSRTDKGFNLIYTEVAGQQGCGGVFNSHSGTLSSPNFPNPYSSNEDCIWIIQPGHALILTFNNIDLPGESPCTTDYVEIRDGSTPTSPLIGQYCGQITPPQIISNENSLWIKFKSGEASNYVGFSIDWKIACGGVFTAPSGMLQSPFYGTGGDNSSDELCIFVIRQPSSMKISLVFNEFGQSEFGKDLKNCTSNYVEIRHGDSKSSPLLGKYCGSENIPSASVAQSLMRIEYKGGPNSLGFQANYTARNLHCGGVLTGNIGSIASPQMVVSRTHLPCVWHIIVDPDKLIQLTFTSFHFFRTCSSIYVELLNEGESTGQRYCGQQIPPVYTSTSNKLQFRFFSYFTTFRSSFQAVYHAINQSNVCGGILQSSTDIVMSPNFPEKYPRMISCIWTIKVPMNHQIQLNFSDFELERSHSCVYDSLIIRDGGSSESPLMGKYCGKKSPFTLLSHSNQIWLMFVTDSSIEKKGFKLSYNTAITGCGGDFLSPSGTIISSNYYNSFRRPVECAWRIHVSAGNRVALIFTDYSFIYRCSLSSVEVREPDRHGRQLGKYCGQNTPLPLISSTNSLYILMKTKTYLRVHFNINYLTVCKNIQLDEVSGIIESPGFPALYTNMLSCSWIISGIYGSTISIEFSSFDIENNVKCRYDYVEIRDGDKVTSPLLGRYCGNMLVPSFTSTGSKMRIDFITDQYQTGTGFRIEYRQNACIKKIKWDYGHLRFPEDRKNYQDVFCIWIIKVRPGMKIQLNVTVLKLDGADSCNDEFLKISDGDSLKSPVLTTVCHTTQQTAMATSTGNKMTVIYKVQNTTKERKLRAVFKIVPGGCGGTYSMINGAIKSPNYPHNYPYNLDCSWLILPKKAHFIFMKFEDFEMGSAGNCTDNYLQISQNNEVSEVFCHGDILAGRNFTFESSVLLSFKTNDKSVAKGFKLNYTQECGNTYYASMGGIISSDDLQGAKSCRWLLIANQSDERVTLHFSKFSSSINCEKEYIRIYNGFDEMAPIISTYCGRRLPPQITSSGSGLYIVARKMKHLVFHATYSTSVSSCGGEIHAATGSISTPGYPANYPLNIQCIWKLKIAPGNRIHVSFSEFSLETYNFCNKDYLEARNVKASGSLIGRFCEGKPQNITSSGDLWLKFRSDEDNTRSGFIANYVQIFGGSISGSYGEISVPSWDSPTTPVVWTIIVDSDLVVFILLKQMRFFIFQDECIGYLEIRDGLSADSRLIGHYCRDEKISLSSSSNRIYIKYAPFRNYKQEFSLDWRAVTNITAMSLINQGQISTPNCSHNIQATDTLQNITSTGFPNGYPPNLFCKWYIYTIKGFQIWINFTTVHLEFMCNADYIKYKMSSSGYSYTLCGLNHDSGKHVLSPGNQFYLRFKSDSSVSGSGFAATFKRLCGGTVLIKTSWIIESNKFISDCTWVVHTLMYYKVKLKVVFYSYQNNCTDDYLQINDGSKDYSPPLLASSSRFCRTYNHWNQTFESNGSYMYIRLRKDYGPPVKLIIQKKGLDCGGNIYLNNAIPSGYIQSINYPQTYPRNTECEWIISAPGLQRVQIDFNDVDIYKQYRRCRRNFLQFYDGSTRNSPLIKTVCGTNPNISTIYSQGNVMYILFRTSSNSVRKGFKLKYSIAKCGGKLVARTGILKSEHYPMNYENNLNCQWNIRVREDHFILLDFLDFKLEDSTNCTADFLEIKENMLNNSIVLYRGCGFTIPSRIQSTGNDIVITFKTNRNRVFQGFKLNFTESNEECGAVLENNFGTISSPGYPDTVKIRRMCKWKIRVRSDRSITLHFTDRESLVCGSGYIRVFNSWSDYWWRFPSFCSNIPETLQLYGNEATVMYSNVGRTPTKVSFSYDSDQERWCGGLLTSVSGNITFHLPTNNSFFNLIQCSWLIQPPIRANMTTVIDLSNLKMRRYCYWKMLQIYEGVDVTGKRIARICSNPKLKWIMSSSPSLFILYSARQVSGEDKHLAITYNSKDCGGILTDESGVITSPNFPSSYPLSTRCYWKIIGSLDFKINITVMDMDLETSSNCEKDYVDILNGDNHDSPSFGKMCSHKNKISYITQGNKAIIIFQSDNTTRARGFRLIYTIQTEVCGGYHHGKKGKIMSPNYPNSYPANKECVWKIKAAMHHVISLKFIPPFDLERSTNCENDYVMLEGKLMGSNEIQQKKFCNYENIQHQEYNSTNEVTVTFNSNNRISGSGFLMEWESECSSYFYEESGYIFSPSYPGSYPSNMHCNYIIMADAQSYVKIKIEDFALEISPHCRMDYLRIRFGNTFRRVYTFCGNRGLHRTLMLHAPVKIEFKTDREISNRGFKISYQIEKCGGVYTANSGYIENVRHNNRYLRQMNCTYIIKVQEGRVISLKFSEFQLERHSKCNYDYLSVYDGNSTGARLIGKFCGWDLPDPIKSRTNSLLLHFVTDQIAQHTGFKAFYQNTFGNDVGCGGELSNSTGLLRSVDTNNDGFYENNMYCHWKITVDADKAVQLVFESFDVQSSANCEKDSLTILSYIDKEKYCGYQIPSPITSVSNKMEVWFRTDASIERSGFRATYSSVLNFCGGQLQANETAGTIASPTRASLYQPHHGIPKCRWIITVPDNYEIMINITQLDILPNCSDEYLLIRDMPAIPGHFYKYCGRVLPHIYYSHRSSVEVNFITTALSESEKFRLQYVLASCNRNYTANHGEIFSPGWPGNYRSRVKCNITITSPVGTRLSLYFRIFKLESHFNCKYDYLQVKYFTNSTHLQTSIFCSPVLPLPIFAYNNTVQLYFKSDMIVEKEGYHIVFTSTTQDSGCGGNLTGINGTFTSPNYPGLYPATQYNNTVPQNKECQWNIQVPIGKQITLIFEEFSLGQNSDVKNCVKNHVKIYKGPRSPNLLYTTECDDNTRPDSVISTSNTMTVVMASDGVARTPKFRISYTS